MHVVLLQNAKAVLRFVILMARFPPCSFSFLTSCVFDIVFVSGFWPVDVLLVVRYHMVLLSLVTAEFGVSQTQPTNAFSNWFSLVMCVCQAPAVLDCHHVLLLDKVQLVLLFKLRFV